MTPMQAAPGMFAAISLFAFVGFAVVSIGLDGVAMFTRAFAVGCVFIIGILAVGVGVIWLSMRIGA